MRYKILFFLLLTFFISRSQTINLNESYITNYLRTSQLSGELQGDISFTLKPLDIGKNGLEIDKEIFNSEKYAPELLNFFNNKGKIKLLPINYNLEFNSHHPYNRNNGSMIPNRGYQHILSAGLYIEFGPLSIQIKPEQLFSENKDYQGFGEGEIEHYGATWANRYNLWNHIDIPERFGENQINKILIGQSSIKLNFNKLSFGISNENIWWGPSIRNSIMMSNHARGFKHFTFNTIRPIKTNIGNFEWQFVTGRLEKSGFNPPNTDYTFAGTQLFVPKINQIGNQNDWRFFQGLTFTYSPKWIDGLSLGFIRWVQMYSALIEGKYTWMVGNTNYFPLFSNLFRKNDESVDYEQQTDQAASIFFRWHWKDSKAEIYTEFAYNDAKQNFRDLLLDSDHARAFTIGFQKIFNSKIKNINYLVAWEWTKMEQTASRLLRNAGSWYMHSSVHHGYTNYGEVLGSGIGPGSNSQYLSFSRIKKFDKIGFSLEIIDQDNDFFYYAFEDAQDYRRYWKDYNLHINIDKKFNNFWISGNFIFSRSLNYQWELDDFAKPYYHAGYDANNFHSSLKIIYEIPID